jgi:Cdc6-like AAA superfamily ATPase
MVDDIEGTTLAQRIILCCLADLTTDGVTPANSAEIRELATKRLNETDTDAVGHLTEADVMRALNALVESDLVEERSPDDRSPVGKGRLRYSLADDPEAIRTALRTDDRIEPLLN